MQVYLVIWNILSMCNGMQSILRSQTCIIYLPQGHRIGETFEKMLEESKFKIQKEYEHNYTVVLHSVVKI